MQSLFISSHHGLPCSMRSHVLYKTGVKERVPDFVRLQMLLWLCRTRQRLPESNSIKHILVSKSTLARCTVYRNKDRPPKWEPVEGWLLSAYCTQWGTPSLAFTEDEGGRSRWESEWSLKWDKGKALGYTDQRGLAWESYSWLNWNQGSFPGDQWRWCLAFPVWP